MRKILEVIVTSVEDAIEAEAGGADRLELVRKLEVGGLTPERGLVEAVLRAVGVPVRVMLREDASMSAGGEQQILAMTIDARFLGGLPIDGIVAGFITDQRVDESALSALLSAAPATHFTFHRAFDELADPLAALDVFRSFPQIDRILTTGGGGSWAERKERLVVWQQAAGPAITILVGAGVCADVMADLRGTPELREVHVGRAARRDKAIAGPVQRANVRALKSVLQ